MKPSTSSVSPVHVDEMKAMETFKCEECNSVFTQDVNLRRHKKMAHRMNSKISKIGIVEPKFEKKGLKNEKKKKKKFLCTDCGLVLHNSSNLSRHKIQSCHKQNDEQKKAIDGALFKCNDCKKEYTCLKRLLTHKKLTRHDNVNDMENNGINVEYGGDAIALSNSNETHNPAYTSMESDGMSVLFASTLAFSHVHEAVKKAMEEIHQAVFPIYTQNNNNMKGKENGEPNQEQALNERISKILRSYANFINDYLQRDSFIISDLLLRDIESLN